MLHKLTMGLGLSPVDHLATSYLARRRRYAVTLLVATPPCYNFKKNEMGIYEYDLIMADPKST